MLATRAVGEMGDRVLLVAADQRGSRPLEKLLRKADTEAFNPMFKTLMDAVPELAPNQYASHVLQSALASWADRLGEEADKQPSAAPLVALCQTLQDDGGWPALIHSPCGSHVVRAMILALGGYAPGQDTRDRAAVKAGLLPEKKYEVPAVVVECRRSVATVFVTLVREDDGVCLNAHASPVMQLLLRVLRDRGVRSLLSELATAIIGASSSGDMSSVDTCEGLLQSAPGSRTFEAVVETCSAETFASLFSKFFRPRLSALVKGEAGDFGAFLAQRVADGLRDEPQLMLALSEVDFTSCLKPEASQAQQTIAVKFCEACLRLRAGLKVCSAEVFRSLDLRESSEYHRVWPTILALEKTDSPAALLRPIKAPKAGENADNVPPPTVKGLPAAGPLLLGALLRFPADAVQQLNSGLPKFLENREVLVAMARGAKTARVLEGALAPHSALLPKLRARLARCFKGALGGLGPHPVGGWVCASLWRASLGDVTLRAAFAEELVAVEDALKAHNFAVWKVCGLHQAKVRKEEWTEQQDKASKSKRLFDSLLEDADPEAAKAAASARVRAAEDAADKEAARSDPLLASLLPADLVGAGADDEDAGLDRIQDEDAEPEEAYDAELDDLFSTKKEKRRKGVEVIRVPLATSSSRSTMNTSGLKTKPKVVDSALAEALQLISGKSSSTNVRKKAKKKKAAAAAQEASDEDASASEPEKVAEQAPTKKVKRLKKRRRSADTSEPKENAEQGSVNKVKRLKKRRRTSSA